MPPRLGHGSLKGYATVRRRSASQESSRRGKKLMDGSTDKHGSANTLSFLFYPCLSVFIRVHPWPMCFLFEGKPAFSFPHGECELPYIPAGAGGFADARPILAKQRPEPPLGGFRVPRLHLIGAGKAQREIPTIPRFQPHEDQAHPAGQMARGHCPQIVLVDRPATAAGGSRLAPAAPPGGGAQKPGYFGNRPPRAKNPPGGGGRGGWRPAHASMISLRGIPQDGG